MYICNITEGSLVRGKEERGKNKSKAVMLNIWNCYLLAVLKDRYMSYLKTLKRVHSIIECPYRRKLKCQVFRIIQHEIISM